MMCVHPIFGVSEPQRGIEWHASSLQSQVYIAIITQTRIGLHPNPHFMALSFMAKIYIGIRTSTSLSLKT